MPELDRKHPFSTSCLDVHDEYQELHTIIVTGSKTLCKRCTRLGLSSALNKRGAATSHPHNSSKTHLPSTILPKTLGSFPLSLACSTSRLFSFSSSAGGAEASSRKAGLAATTCMARDLALASRASMVPFLSASVSAGMFESVVRRRNNARDVIDEYLLVLLAAEKCRNKTIVLF